MVVQLIVQAILFSLQEPPVGLLELVTVLEFVMSKFLIFRYIIRAGSETALPFFMSKLHLSAINLQ
jgi:hypothetical protein